MQELVEQIRRNCAISDAKFWGYYSICGLLMRYRELYRNEQGLKPWERIEKERITAWIEERERLWKSLEHEDLQQLVIGGAAIHAFDVNRVNTLLNPSGLVYGSGYSLFGKPTFFLAELIQRKEIYDYRVYYAGRELCRDLAASPAMLQGRCIYIRIEVLESLLWDKFQELGPRKQGSVLEEIFSLYGITKEKGAPEEDPAAIGGKIESMARDIADLFVLHEIGEAYEDDNSDAWLGFLSVCNDKHCETYTRGIKDLMADTSEMGPLKTIIRNEDAFLLKCYMVFLDGIRKTLFPEIGTALRRFNETGDWSTLEHARNEGYRKAGAMKSTLLQLFAKDSGEKGLSAAKDYLRSTFARA
ncbi:MAG: Sfum_1244 family protein [Nitrospirota bacterium]